MKKPKIIIGNKYGKLLVIEKTKKPEGLVGSKGYYLCKCDCGKEVVLVATSLTTGNTKSCGCYRKEKAFINYGKASFNKAFYTYKYNSLKRNFEFLLPKEEFLNLCKKDCYYCGSFPSNIQKNDSKNGDFVYNGIDRVDPLQGYTILNTVSCCIRCNRAKSNMTINEFKSWIEQVYNHFK